MNVLKYFSRKYTLSIHFNVKPYVLSSVCKNLPLECIRHIENVHRLMHQSFWYIYACYQGVKFGRAELFLIGGAEYGIFLFTWGYPDMGIFT